MRNPSRPMSRLVRQAAILTMVAGLAGCDKKSDDESSSTEEEVVPDASTGVASDAKQPGDVGGTSDGAADESPVVASDCGSLKNGETGQQTRYAAATAVKGLATCQSETQTVKCEDGTLASTGTYTQASCEEVTASVEAGDVLVVTEDGGGGTYGQDGQIRVFSKTQGFKGIAFDTTGIVPWYSYGLRLSSDYFDDGAYHVEIGSSNAALAISVRRFAKIEAYPYTFSMPVEGAASDAVYFQGAFSEEYNTVRLVATEDGAHMKTYSFGAEVPDCEIVMPAGEYARAIYSGTQFNFYPTYVAYTLGTGTGVTGYGVAKLTGSCHSAGGTPMTPVTQFEMTSYPDAKISSVLHVRTNDAGGATSWKGDLFVTVGPFLSGTHVTRWHYDSGTTTWSEVATGFLGSAVAVFQDGLGDVYTIETGTGSSVHLRRYTTAENAGTHFVETLYTDESGEILTDASLGHWMVVMPTL